MKRILVVHYSQTGQLSQAVMAMMQPLEQAGHLITSLHLQPQTPFPFPWPPLKFLDVFPESAGMRPGPLCPLDLPASAEFDLVILAYQVWYLSPSQPMTAFLQSPDAARLLHGKPVVTLVACRNMWLMAQEKVKGLVAAAGGVLRDHIALTDPPEHAISTFITTPRWLLTGRRNAFWSLPAAGIPAEELQGTARFGHALVHALANDEERQAAPMLAGLRAAPVDTRIILSERAGHRAFKAWSRLLMLTGEPRSLVRQPLLLLFCVYLVLMIFTVVPISRLLQVLLSPLIQPRLRRLQQYYEAPSGAGKARLADVSPSRSSTSS